MRRHVVFAVVCVLVAAEACGSTRDVPDGSACSDNADCQSSYCTSGRCLGKQCSCAGPACTSPNPCDDGWRCASHKEAAWLHCMRSCSAEQQCPSGQTCEEGVCAAESAVLKVEWAVRPGDRPCVLGRRCRYEVRLSQREGLIGFTWSFGDGRPEELVDPDVFAVEHEFAKAGTFQIEVRARFNAKVVSINAAEHVCIGDDKYDCRPTPGDCCAGTCTLSGQCR
jgi:hypothetical protein